MNNRNNDRHQVLNAGTSSFHSQTSFDLCLKVIEPCQLKREP
jgi:hypothetical protein